ncbi:MAG: hypothetical protein RIQ33_1695 [Bacteroidota bacterium]
MKETLTIKNFGPIKDITLELGKVNVLIGEQGMGKSTIAKVLAHATSYEFRNFFMHNFSKPFNTLVDFNIKEYLQKDNSNIIFESDSFKLENETYTLKDDLIDRLYQEGLKTVTFEDEKIKGYRKIEIETHNKFGFPVFIPTERLAMFFLQSDVFSLNQFKQYPNSFPKYFNEYGKSFNVAKKALKNKEQLDFKTEFKIEFDLDNNDNLLIKVNGITHDILQSASGYQSIAPILIVLRFYQQNFESSFKYRYILEEPELHLFPSIQNDLVRFLAESTNGNAHSLTLTTHSPYTLTSLNNLMFAYQLGQKNEEEVDKIIPKKYWLNPSDVSAYYLSNGKAESIIDETGLIDATKIDGISEINNEEYDKLCEIKFGK